MQGFVEGAEEMKFELKEDYLKSFDKRDLWELGRIRKYYKGFDDEMIIKVALSKLYDEIFEKGVEKKMADHKCYSCGGTEALIFVERGVARTSGFDVPLAGEYACAKCVKEDKVIIS